MVKVSFGARKIETTKTQTKSLAKLVGSRNAALITGAFVGVAASLPLSVAFLAPMISGELASNNAQPIVMRTADANIACVAPAGNSGPLAPGKGGSMPQNPKHETSSYAPAPGPSSPQTQYVTKLVGGSFASNNSLNENNGAKNGKAISVNVNVIKNTNTAEVNNATNQSANSGNLVNAGNKGAGGNASTGDANNENGASFVVNQNN